MKLREVIVTAVIHVKTGHKERAIETVQKHLFRANDHIRRVKQIVIKATDNDVSDK